MYNWTPLAALPLLALGVAGCDMLGKSKAEEKTVAATTTKVSSAAGRLCAANATYARLKESAFAEAKTIREGDTEALDALADASVVRMENPLLESRDEALGLTVCSGRMVLELPPGAATAFDGRQRLAADITYSAQAAADGSGTVYKIDGGEPIVYRLASFDPRRGTTRTANLDMPVTDRMPPPSVETPDEDSPVPAPPPSPRPPNIPEQRARAAAESRADDPQAEQTDRAARMRAADRRAAAERARERAAATAAAERAAAVERRARAERIAEARRTERGERVEERPTRTAAAPRTARPSFNCRYARSRVEKLICNSNDLASRDREMAALYYRTNDSSDAVVRRRLSASRLRFLAYRDRCASEACVADAYADRIDEINDLADE